MSHFSYKTLRLNLNPVNVSISRDGKTLSPASDQTGLARVTSLKNSALAMALGYVTFLNLTDIATDLKNQGASEGDISAILSWVNINQWVATTFQESEIEGEQKSGFFQIDNSPEDIANNAMYTSNEKYYTFLTHLRGGAKIEEKDAIINGDTKQGFVWQAVEKGYYDAISYFKNKEPFNNIPTPNFNFAQWALDYAKTQAATHAPLPEAEHQDVEIQPTAGLCQALALMYNRGQFPFVHPDQAPLDLLVKLMQENTSFEEVMPYPSEFSNDPSNFGKRYVWQLPWLITLLNQGDDVYAEVIDETDMLDLLNILTDFYGSNASQNKIIDAGNKAVKELNWGHAYNAPETFENIDNVVKALMAASAE